MTELATNSSEKEELSDNSVEKWFAVDNFKEIKEKNIYPNITVFNRKLYTFGDSKEVFIKFSRINSLIPSQDEITYLDTRSCMVRISQDRYIVVVSNEKGETAVIGELLKRYISKNNLNQYDTKIHNAEEYKILSLSDLYDPETLTADKLVEYASSRIKTRFEKYITYIRG
ncbi:uncharacterized protein RJT21DRAFT_124039 [Scheffersomyces amazonensis]|uniref:uncharacterized protein n=1 Tax=Scheffersomyces amazonensis TaxID=1078765 RepID=UPI00315C7195